MVRRQRRVRPLAWTLASLTGRPRRASTVGLVALVATQLGQTLLDSRSPLVVMTAAGSLVGLAALITTPGPKSAAGQHSAGSSRVGSSAGVGERCNRRRRGSIAAATCATTDRRLGCRPAHDFDDADTKEHCVQFPQRDRQGSRASASVNRSRTRHSLHCDPVILGLC